jgi:hypothetical protein
LVLVVLFLAMLNSRVAMEQHLRLFVPPMVVAVVLQ